MSWVFVSDLTRQAPKAEPTAGRMNGTSQNPNNGVVNGGLLAKGSVLAEFDMGADGHVPTRLVHFETDQDWVRRFSIYLNADHSVSVETQQGLARSYVRLGDWMRKPTERARLTYSWDAPARIGLLSIECLDSGTINQNLFETPVPLPLFDAEQICAAGPSTQLDARLASLAISDEIEAIGPAPSIAGDTLVETAKGQRQINRLETGDEVLTFSNGVQPIRWIVKQDLPASGSFRPISLRAPYFGLRQDITVNHMQKIMISGADAEYLFGKEGVMVEARQLLGHPAATLQSAEFTKTYYQLLFDNHECIRLSGIWGESLFVGDLANVPELLATSRLSQLPRSAMPVHREPVGTLLQNYETRTLLDALSA